MTPLHNPLYTVLLLPCLVFMSGESPASSGQPNPFEIVLKTSGDSLMTGVIQRAIDSCAMKGGGVVRFTGGCYHSGTLQLKSKVTLYLAKDALIQGSNRYSDYINDAFFFGRDLSDFTIEGEGVIDGVDCYNPLGEEGFRGPHCIRLIGCKDFTIRGITIKNSANWAINCRYCSGAKVDKVTILGGHDGLHTRFCDNFTVSGCDFRTGDDAFAGNDNRDLLVTDCSINTSCNGFRMGCLNLTVQRCRFWGPGEYIHKIQQRHNMLSAFVHFSPEDENPQLESGNWIIRDVAIENVDHVYRYNFEDGLWQTGQPVTSVRFENVKATGVLSTFSITGDTERQFSLTVLNSSFGFREGTEAWTDIFEGVKMKSTTFFNVCSFDQINLRNVVFEKKEDPTLLYCVSGNTVILDNVRFNTGSGKQPTPMKIENVSQVKKQH